MPTWDPAQYLRFDSERLRPALDLLGRVPLHEAGNVVDLGCGPGTVTAILKKRFPEARVIGVDASEEMLERAAKDHPDIAWTAADIRSWRPREPVDLLLSNAALQWIDKHESLLPRLLELVRPGGVLAVQMPNNFDAPTHTAIAETLREMSASAPATATARPSPVLAPTAYYELLAPGARHIDLWETTYLHVLEGDDPVVEWTKGSALRPVLDALDDPEREKFLDGYRDRVRAAYPPRPDGTILLPFKRLFFVVTAR